MNEESLPVAGMWSVKSYKSIEYKNVGGRPLLLDLHVPTEAKGKVPLLFYIHGGGWCGGTKDDATNLAAFIKAGYAMSALDYRFSNEAIFPAQIEDVKAALRWLRAHVGEFQLDPDRVGAWGHSAGGHLVSLLGVTGASRLFDVGDNLHVSSQVLGVGSVAGPMDLLSLANNDILPTYISDLFGGHPNTRKELAQSANPINHIDKDTPPFVIIHGEKDDMVPCQQAELLHAALNNKGIPSRLVIQAGIDHDNWRHPQMVGELIQFFDALLK